MDVKLLEILTSLDYQMSTLIWMLCCIFIILSTLEGTLLVYLSSIDHSLMLLAVK